MSPPCHLALCVLPVIVLAFGVPACSEEGGGGAPGVPAAAGDALEPDASDASEAIEDSQGGIGETEDEGPDGEGDVALAAETLAGDTTGDEDTTGRERVGGWPEGYAGITDGAGLVVEPGDLEGLHWFGIGVEPGTPLGSFEEYSAVGVLVLPSIIEVHEEHIDIRVWDLEEEEPVEGSSGLIERYAAVALGDGTLRIDFEEPLVGLEIQFTGDCVYALEGYSLSMDPVFDAGLMTWAAVELYLPDHCGGFGLEGSLGINVHFLRRFDLSGGYEPRAVDPDEPFGFFQIDAPASGGEPEGAAALMTRMPDVAGATEDGAVVYHVNPGFPEHLRGAVDGIFEGWNDALEPLVGVRPFSVVDAEQPIIPWDPRYHVVHWDPDKVLGAIAPFVEDPLTGAMMDTDVLVWLSDMSKVVEGYQEFFAEHPDVPFELPPESMGIEALPAFTWAFEGGEQLPPRVPRRRFFSPRPFGPGVVGQAIEVLASTGMGEDEDPDAEAPQVPPAEDVERYIMNDYLTHEVGHNLGLRHNFKGSLDRDLHPAAESATTCMDYVVGMTRPGTYDVDAMRYAYGPGPDVSEYAYCTDEDTELDPGCARWDFGHPVQHFLDVLTEIAEEHGPDTPLGEMDALSQEGDWDKVFRRLRLFVGTDYEDWDPEAPLSVVEDLLARIVCASPEVPEADPPEGEEAPAEVAPCPHHLWLRGQYALYLLYTRFIAQSDGEWHDFPDLDEAEADLVLGTYRELIMDPAQSMPLKKVIIEKLPTAKLEGALDLLDILEGWLAGLEAPSEAEQELALAVAEAQAEVQ